MNNALAVAVAAKTRRKNARRRIDRMVAGKVVPVLQQANRRAAFQHTIVARTQWFYVSSQ
jgi:hypothetical protein